MTDDPEAELLDAVRSDPGDLQAIQVYADWLEERGDPRGEYLRLGTQLTAIPARLVELGNQIDPVWLRAVHGRFRISIVALGPNKIMAIKIVRELTGIGLKEAKDLVESASEASPALLLDDVELEQARTVARQCAPTMTLRFEPHLPAQGVAIAPSGPIAYRRPYRVLLVGVTDRVATIRHLHERFALGLGDARDVVERVIAGAPFELASRVDGTSAAEVAVRFGALGTVRIEHV